MNFDLILQNEKILLRPSVNKDIEEFILLTADKNMWIYFTHDLSDRLELEKWVNDSLLEKANKTRIPFTIIEKSSNKIIGATSFGNISNRDKRIEIGWTWIGKEYQGKGINNQVKYLMLKYCMEVLKFERIEFKTDVLNVPARKALSQMNITEEGILRSHTLMTNGRRRDTIYYSVLKPEWSELKTRNNWR